MAGAAISGGRGVELTGPEINSHIRSESARDCHDGHTFKHCTFKHRACDDMQVNTTCLNIQCLNSWAGGSWPDTAHVAKHYMFRPDIDKLVMTNPQ